MIESGKQWHVEPGPRGAGEPIVIRDERGGIVCRVEAGPDAEADARLIAAAPLLLAAGEAALRYDESIAGRAARGEYSLVDESGVATGDDLDALYRDWMQKAHEAIARTAG